MTHMRSIACRMIPLGAVGSRAVNHSTEVPSPSQRRVIILIGFYLIMYRASGRAIVGCPVWGLA